MGSVAGPRAYATATSTTASTPINLGGKDLLSAAQMSLVRRAAALLETLGLERRARNVSLSCLANENAPFSPLRARLAAEAGDAEATE